MKKIFLLLIGLFALSACYSAPDAVKPAHKLLFSQMPKDAPNNYKLGWIDGCESGLSSMTNTAYKTFYSFKQNPEMRDDPTYYAVWKDTYNFCRHYIYGTIRLTDQRMNLPNARTQFMTQFMGTDGILNVGLLNLWGPGGGTALLPFQKVGDVGGDSGWPLNIGGQGTIDFSDDSVLNGNRGGLDWDFNQNELFVQ